MANVLIRDLIAVTSANPGDLVELNVDPSGTPLSRKITVANLLAGAVTNPLSADLDVGGFDIIGASPGSGAGGAVEIRAGASTDDDGGVISVLGGDGDVNGGGITINAGSANTGEGGSFNANAGASTSGPGGSLGFSSGSGDTLGGDVVFNAGLGFTGPGGNIYFNSGGSFGSAQGGDITFNYGSGGTRNGLFFPNLPTSDPGVSGAAWVDGVTVKISP